MDSIIIIVFILVCLLLESLYSGGEIAYVSSDINRVKNKVKSGSASARLALRLLDSPEWFLATTLTGTNLFIVTSTTLMTMLCLSFFGQSRGEVISLLLMIPTLFVMIVSRNIFQQHAETLAMKLSWFIWISSLLFFPVVYLLAKISRGAVKISAGETGRSFAYVTKDGLKYVLEKQGQDSDILSVEKDMVKNIIDFSDVTAGDIMVPLSAMTALSAESTLDEAVQIAAGKRYLRFPVYRDQVFNVIGILHFFDLLETIHRRASNQANVPGDQTIESCIKPVTFYIPETKPAKELLIELRVRAEKMAVVVDEYGGAVGIVTIEDILEEIVGEIEDEHGSGEKRYKKIGPRKYLFSANMHIEKVRQLVSIDIPDGDYETLGGFLLYKMGKIPQRKETLRYGDITFVIEDADAKSIKAVMIVPSSDFDKATAIR
jgi:putative hemolysin